MPRNDHQLPPIVRKMPWSTSDMTTSTDCNTARPFTTGCCSGCTKLTKCRLFVVVRVLVVVVVVVVWQCKHCGRVFASHAAHDSHVRRIHQSRGHDDRHVTTEQSTYTSYVTLWTRCVDRWLVECERRMRRRPCSLSHRRRRISESMFITACSMHDYDEEKTAQQNLFVRSGKSEVEVTNNRRLCSTYVLHYWSYWQTRSITRPLCNSRATNTVSLGTGWNSTLNVMVSNWSVFIECKQQTTIVYVWLYRVGQIKRGKLTFSLVTSERNYKTRT